MKKIFQKILCVVVFFLMIHISLANDIYFSKIGIEQGLSQFSVMSIYQDEIGSIWLGTREGVSVYNGYEMEIFRPQPNDSNSLKGNIIKSICGDRNGHVYIHSQNGLNEYNLQTMSMNSISSGQIDAVSYGTAGLWIAKGNKIFLNNGNTETLFAEILQNKSPITVITQSSDQRIFVGTLSSGVYVVDTKGKVRKALSSNIHVSTIFEDNKKNVWVGTWLNGLYKIERNGNIKNYTTQSDGRTSISDNFVRAICEDANDHLWIGTKKGLDRLTVESEVFKHYDASENNSRHLSNESIWALMKDSQGTIWAGTYFGGVNYFNPDADLYTFHDLHNGIFQNKPFPVISNIVEDKAGNLYFATEGNGLIHYNPSTFTYKNITSEDKSESRLTTDNIKVLYYDSSSDELWLGFHLGGLGKLNLKNQHFKKYRDVMPNLEQSDIVRAILPLDNALLIATYNGAFIFDKKTERFSVFSEKLNEIVKYCVDIKKDNLGNYWIAGKGLHYFDTHKETVKSYFYDANNNSSISSDVIQKIFIDSKDRVWIATNGGGLNMYQNESDSFVRYTSYNSELENDYISNIIESQFGYLLIATTQGLSTLDVENNKIYNYNTENGFPLNSLFNGGMCLMRDGEIFIAGMNGIISLYEENLADLQYAFNLHFVRLEINNHRVKVDDKTGVLKKALPYTDKIILPHKHRVIGIQFASGNYIRVNKPNFRYRLEGFSDAWTELPQGINQLNFMNLSEGNYRLTVEAISPGNEKCLATTSLDVKILPPMYRTWYAYLLYFVLCVLIVWRIISFSKSKLLLKTSLEYEKKEKENIEEANQSKLKFFTNISHEFRTPLTLISGQIDVLLQSNNIQPSVYNRILSIKRNTQNMQNLITELLEFRKIEQGHLKIKASKQNIVEFVYEIYLSFLEYANYRKINFTFDCAESNIDLWFDPAQLQKVFYNLISNAFKYTQQEGAITISIEQDTESVYIQILDSGIGVSPDEVDRIFDSFYQAENGLQINNVSSGTGIGLALTKSILTAHAAQIRVNSQLQVGSRFTITMQKGCSHFSEEQITDISDSDSTCIQQLRELDPGFIKEVIQTQNHSQQESSYSILIVEDNEELRLLLENIFEPIYNIYIASDGEEGVKLALEHQPDIILSDLMMPKMSGIEMCSKIKNNFSTSHIPVVLLTAQTAIESNIEGLRIGADDYITKPFNVKTLISRCNNLVNGRKLLQEKYSKQVGTSARLIATNNLDREFIEKAQEIIEKNIDNPQFDVTAFSREMALGRTKLFEKIKGITGQTPNDFMLTVRLKKAAAWLNNNPEYNITDISYMAGFNSPKYFTKCFKDQFGVSPSSFRKNVSNDTDS